MFLYYVVSLKFKDAYTLDNKNFRDWILDFYGGKMKNIRSLGLKEIV